MIGKQLRTESAPRAQTQFECEPVAPRRIQRSGVEFAGTAFSDDLDLIRGLAALAVFVGHIRTLFYLNAQAAGPVGVTTKLLYFVTGLGHEAVVVFFVLSGLLIGNSVVRANASGRWSWNDYIFNRASRLLVVLLPALALGAVWDNIGLLAPSSFDVYRFGSSALTNFGSAIVGNNLTIPIWVGNLFFLQTIAVPVFGSNVPLWSLSNEFWYYLIFPCLFIASIGKQSPLTRLGLFLAGLAGLIFVGADIALYMLIWLMGAALNIKQIHAKSIRSLWGRTWVVLCAGAFVGTLILAKLHTWERLVPSSRLRVPIADYPIGITFASRRSKSSSSNLTPSPQQLRSSPAASLAFHCSWAAWAS